MQHEGLGEGCRRWGGAVLCERGQALLEGTAMGSHAALPCSCRTPSISHWHQEPLQWGAAEVMPWDGGAAPGRAG